MVAEKENKSRTFVIFVFFEVQIRDFEKIHPWSFSTTVL